MTSTESSCAYIPQRWIFALMCFLALFNAYAMRACLSITITEMVKKPVEDSVKDTGTCTNLMVSTSSEIMSRSAILSNETSKPENFTIHHELHGERYDWDEYKQGIILSSFYWGYVVTHLPGGLIAEKYGGKHTLGIGILSTAVFTLLTPLAIRWGDYPALVGLRILMGLGEGTTYPAINVLLAQWTPPEERSRTGSFVYAGALIGTIYATTVSAIILKYSVVGWHLVFYVIGGSSALWFLVWLFACYNNPREHPFISIKEASYLNERIAQNTQDKTGPTPWRHILTSKPLWAVTIALIGFNWSILTIVTDLPKYMSGVLGFDVELNGYITSFIFLCMWLGSTVTSWFADYVIAKNESSRTKVRKIGSVIALTCSAAFILAASYAGCNRFLVVTMFTVAMSMLGTAFPSVMINALDLSPNYAGVLMALTNGISAFTGIFSPYVIGLLTTNQTLNEWRLVFWILFGMSISTNVVFLLFGSGEVEPWNDLYKNSRPSLEEKRKSSVEVSSKF